MSIETEWADTVDDNGDDVRVLTDHTSPNPDGEGDYSEELIPVLMGSKDWEKVVLALRYLGEFSSTALDIESGDLEFLADSISDAAWKE